MEDGIDETKMPVDLNQNGENSIVKKAQQLVTARYNLTTMEIKIIATLISMIRVSDTEFQEYVFRVADWKNEQELKRKDLGKAFKAICIDLMKKPISIRNGEDWLIVNWVSSARYVKKQGVVKFKISDELKPYLLELKKNFLTYDIKNILPIRSAYSIRMYELLKDWWSRGSRYQKSETVIKIIDILWLIKTLQVPESYQYNDIKRRILQKSVTDLKKWTDINFRFEEIKTGHTVTHIKFLIRQNQKNDIEGKKIEKISENKQQSEPPKGTETAKMVELLSMIPVEYRSLVVEKMINEYRSKGVGYIRAQIAYTNNSNAKNYVVYLKNSLKNDWAGVEKSKIAAEIEKKERIAAEAKAAIGAEKEKKEEAERQKMEKEAEKIEKYIENMDQIEKAELEKKILEDLHEKYPDARPASAKFSGLTISIALRKIVRERVFGKD